MSNQPLAIVFGTGFLFVLIAGMGRAFRDADGRLCVLVMLALFATYLPTTRALLRYISVLSPYFLYVGIQGVGRVLDSAKIKGAPRKVVSAGLMGVLILFLIPPFVPDMRAFADAKKVWRNDNYRFDAILPYYLSPWFYEYYTALTSLKTLPDDAVIVASEPHIVYFFTGKHALHGNEYSPDFDDTVRAVRESTVANGSFTNDHYWKYPIDIGAGYVICEDRFSFSKNTLIPAVEACPECFRTIYRSQRFPSIAVLEMDTTCLRRPRDIK
jgi:hypothetical protein